MNNWTPIYRESLFLHKSVCYDICGQSLWLFPPRARKYQWRYLWVLASQMANRFTVFTHVYNPHTKFIHWIIKLLFCMNFSPAVVSKHSNKCGIPGHSSMFEQNYDDTNHDAFIVYLTQIPISKLGYQALMPIISIAFMKHFEVLILKNIIFLSL